ncbi:MAG: WxcM-like domain-containing protein [Crenarchaeota archaeon]|nr:MAG: WxcM-like domain-containing protein [Thermoproteota archaeon]RDJ33319.1 MAG: WxcM-like domain-containing protein [Thermoproteota archaeon]RDJ36178.1 MAG: WxcM-like domain-containing protein [Thermoproteota archaeon]RDJ38809.1 MAG: WxcM-like domain-containing protein [Thermoproteota archaeon]
MIEPFSKKLEKYSTKDVSDSHVNGSLTVIWRDWDKIISHDPKMVYVSSVNPGEIKGPHIHTQRNSFFTCIHGRVIFIIKDKNNTYLEIESSEDEPVMVFVPKNFASAHINLSKNISRVLTLADVAWRPNDNEMINTQFTDYDFNKWK